MGHEGVLQAIPPFPRLRGILGTSSIQGLRATRGYYKQYLPFQEIAVHEQLPFEIQKMGDIENFGIDKKLEIVRGLYIYC